MNHEIRWNQGFFIHIAREHQPVGRHNSIECHQIEVGRRIEHDKVKRLLEGAEGPPDGCRGFFV